MARYEIVGLYDCYWLAKAEKLIEEITSQFPLIEFHKSLKDRFQWNDFVQKMKNVRGWTIKRSPVIWEVLVTPKGKANLIGNIDDFSEYVFAYFGIICDNADHASLQDQVVMNKAIFAKGFQGQDRANKTICNLAIINAPVKMLECVLTQLLSPISIVSPNLLFNIKIYDNYTPHRELDGLGMEAVDVASANLFKIATASSLPEVFYDTHIIMILEDLSRKVEESISDWLTRVEWSVLRYTEPINQVCGDDCRLIIGGDGPQCYVAEIFRKSLTTKKVRSSHIVAVGQHVITRAKASIAAKSDIPAGCISRLHAWGWPGLCGAYVEVNDAVLRDAECSIRGPSPCEIPLGEIATNPEWLYKSFSEDFLFLQRERIFKTRIFPSSDLCMAEAVVNTLHIWLMSSSIYGPVPGYSKQNDCCRHFQKEKVRTTQSFANQESRSRNSGSPDLDDDILLPVICAGVQCSKKSSFPKGTFMVQPAVCYLGKWVPAGKISEKTHERILKEVNKLWEIRQEMICREVNIDGLFKDYDIMMGRAPPEITEGEETQGEFEDEVEVDGFELDRGKFLKIGSEKDPRTKI